MPKGNIKAKGLKKQDVIYGLTGQGSVEIGLNNTKDVKLLAERSNILLNFSGENVIENLKVESEGFVEFERKQSILNGRAVNFLKLGEDDLVKNLKITGAVPLDIELSAVGGTFNVDLKDRKFGGNLVSIVSNSNTKSINIEGSYYIDEVLLKGNLENGYVVFKNPSDMHLYSEKERVFVDHEGITLLGTIKNSTFELEKVNLSLDNPNIENNNINLYTEIGETKVIALIPNKNKETIYIKEIKDKNSFILIGNIQTDGTDKIKIKALNDFKVDKSDVFVYNDYVSGINLIDKSQRVDVITALNNKITKVYLITP